MQTRTRRNQRSVLTEKQTNCCGKDSKRRSSTSSPLRMDGLDLPDGAAAVNPPAPVCLLTVKSLKFQSMFGSTLFTWTWTKSSQRSVFPAPTWQTTSQKTHSSFPFIRSAWVEYSRSIQPPHLPYTSVLQALFQWKSSSIQKKRPKSKPLHACKSTDSKK